MIIRLTLLIILSLAQLCAEYDLQDFSSLQMPVRQRAFTLRGSGDALGKAKIKHHGDHEGKIQYGHAEGEFDAVIYYNDCHQEGISVGVGYEYSNLKWNQNCFFCKRDYNTAFLSTVFFTNRLPSWEWLFSANVNIDANNWEFNTYTSYDLLLWGRYEYNCHIGLHVGVYVETGMKLNLVLPVIGFDWKISDTLYLSAVYPLNISLNYTLNPRWTTAVAIRFFNDRHRAGECGLFYKALWRYCNTGLEAAINYNLCDRLTANLHVGYATGGRLRISNRHNHEAHHIRFNGCGYAGGAITLNF